MSGTSLGSFDLTAANNTPTGVTTDGSSFWVVDKNDLKVYKYGPGGDPISTGDFNLVVGNGFAEGITTDGSRFWVTDTNYKRVYQYSLSGANQGALT